MVKLNASISKATYNIHKFRGLNESENGDGALKDGEASVMRNFRVTDGGALTSRPTLVEHLVLGNAYDKLGRYDASLGETKGYWLYDDFFNSVPHPIDMYSGYTIENGVLDVSGEVVFELLGENPIIPLELTDNAYFKIGNDVYLFGGREGTNAVFCTRIYASEKVQTLWGGYIGGEQKLMAVANERLWEIHTDGDEMSAEMMEGVRLNENAHIFGFNNKLYILTGKNYLSWDGDEVTEVEGYIPCVLTACEPASGSGTNYERINLLSQHRKCRYNANGSATVYKILEAGAAVVEVKVDGEVLHEGTDYTKAIGKVTFNTAPSAGVENVEITYKIMGNSEWTWTKTVQTIIPAVLNHKFVFLNNDYGMEFASFEAYVGTEEDPYQKVDPSRYEVISHRMIRFKFTLLADQVITIKYSFRKPREQVLAMRYSELYNGNQDNRVFLYGDGTNKAIYSGLDENGQPSAEYFPDLNECRFGSDTSPITAIIKHYNRLLVFKDNEAFSVYTQLLTLADGSATTGFYISSVNKQIGCCADAQAVLVENRVRTLDGADIYEWRATNNSGNITLDQRNANRISQRVYDTLSTFVLKDSVLFYDKDRHEFYCIHGDKALVQNVEADAWYYYDGVPITCMCAFDGKLFCGKANGGVATLDRTAKQDFKSEWVSGSLDFDKPYAYKLSPQIWVSIKPEHNKTLTISVNTDNDEAMETSVTTVPIGAVKPTVTAKLKPKRFIRYKLGLKTSNRMTMLGANVSVSYTINTK